MDGRRIDQAATDGATRGVARRDISRFLVGAALGGAFGWSAGGLAATPGMEPTASGSLADLLGRLPDWPLGLTPEAKYADLARQAAALGIDPRQAVANATERARWIAAASELAVPHWGTSKWGSPEWRPIFGFDLFQVEQAAEYVAPPLSITALRGPFDPGALRAAWRRAGYQPIDLGPGEAYAVREDYLQDLADPGSRLTFASFNVVAIADDGTLVAGSTRAGVRDALAAISGQAPSFADRPEIAPLVRAAPTDLVSADLVDGMLLRWTPLPNHAAATTGQSSAGLATQIAVDESEARRLPPVATVLVGQTAGAVAASATASPDAATPTGRAGPHPSLVALLATAGPDAAQTAARVIAERLATQRASTNSTKDVAGHSWAELFPEQKVRIVPSERVVRIELVPAAGISPHILEQMIFTGRPGFLAGA